MLQQELPKTFDENLEKRFANKFILFLQKGVYPYQQMDDCEKSNKISLPEKEDLLQSPIHKKY